jgi:hypothetical protein
MRSRRVLVLSAIAVLGQAGLICAQEPSPAPSGAATAAAVCAPLEGVPPAEGLRILGGQDTSPRFLYGANDLVVVSGGTQSGVQLNQEYFIRRVYAFGSPMRPPAGPRSIHTSGRLRIVAANDATAIAQIVASCDGVLAGDYLEPFVEPAVIANGANGRPSSPATLDFSSLGRVKFGDEQRTIGAAGDFMLIDGADAPLTPGVRVAIYRDLALAGLPLAAIGEGVIVSVGNGTPVMRISSMRDAIRSGDYVVRHK